MDAMIMMLLRALVSMKHRSRRLFCKICTPRRRVSERTRPAVKMIWSCSNPFQHETVRKQVPSRRKTASLAWFICRYDAHSVAVTKFHWWGYGESIMCKAFPEKCEYIRMLLRMPCSLPFCSSTSSTVVIAKAFTGITSWKSLTT